MAVITVHTQGEPVQIEGRPGETLLAALQRGGVRGPEAPCGGNGTCGKCLVEASGALDAPDAHERALLPTGGGLRLACCAKIQGDCAVKLSPPERGAVVACEGGALSFPLEPCVPLPGGRGLGLAVDIGTTTVVSALYDLATGARLGVRGGMNRQRAFGADVISRVNHANAVPGGLEQMAAAVRAQLSEDFVRLCAEAGRGPEEVLEVCVAGNTIMEHIFARLSPASIAVAPFTPLSLFGTAAPAGELGFQSLPNARVYLAPAVAGYVGGDVTAGLLASGACRAEAPVLFLDIGTNGEMALGTREGFTACATAAGPAFEGAEITCGMSGVAGAIGRVWLEDGGLGYSVIGGGAPEGICGSGLVDALAALLSLGAVDETGRLLPPDEAPDGLADRLEEDGDGVRFRLAPGVCITAGDVRKLQLAKAAVAAGIATLLEEAGLTEEDVSALYLAGGFGSYIDKESAGAIGLLPAALLSRTICVGNSAGAGAAAALLSRRAREELSDIRRNCRYLELSTAPAFTGHYVERMTFE